VVEPVHHRRRLADHVGDLVPVGGLRDVGVDMADRVGEPLDVDAGV